MYIEIYTIYGTCSKKLLYSITSKVIQYYKKIENCIEEVEIYFPGFQAFIDSTEQEIQRPKNKKRGRKSTILVRRKNILYKDTIYGQ